MRIDEGFEVLGGCLKQVDHGFAGQNEGAFAVGNGIFYPTREDTNVRVVEIRGAVEDEALDRDQDLNN